MGWVTTAFAKLKHLCRQRRRYTWTKDSIAPEGIDRIEVSAMESVDEGDKFWDRTTQKRAEFYSVFVTRKGHAPETVADRDTLKAAMAHAVELGKQFDVTVWNATPGS
jgi:hypothetical protein